MLSSAAYSQLQYKPWKVDVGFLLGEITHYNKGIIFPYIEPKYNITNNLTLGIRGEYVVFSKEGFADKENPYWNDLDADGSVFSLAATTDFYFTKYTVRPFIGAGCGYFIVKSNHQNNYLNLSENLHTGGFILRTGINMGHFKFSGEYNYILSNKVNINYFSLKLGYEIGGGKKNIW